MKRFFVVAFLLLLYIAPLIFVTSYSPTTLLEQEDRSVLSDGEGWLAGWAYRKQHNISGAAGAGENYTVCFDVWWDGAISTISDNGVSNPQYGMVNWPSSIYYNNATYITWQGGDTTPDIFVRMYNHTSRSWSATTNVAPSGLTSNDHAAPTIMLDGNGYIHLFFGYHSTTPMYHYKSDNSEDVSAFTKQSDFLEQGISSIAYPKAVSVGNNMYVFYSETDLDGSTIKRRFKLNISEDNGATFDNGQYIVMNYAGGTDYGVYAGHVAYYLDGPDPLFHMTWTYAEEGEPEPARKHAYHAYLNVTDSEMYSMGGTNLGANVTKDEADNYCLVFSDATNQTYIPALHVDTEGIPWIIYNTGTVLGGWGYYHTKWNGTGWNTPKYITNTGFKHQMFDFEITNTSEIIAYLPVSDIGVRGGDMEEWALSEGSWEKIRTLMYANETGYELNNPCVPYNASLDVSRTIRLIWCEMKDTIYTGFFRVYAFGNIFEANNIVSLEAKAQGNFDDFRVTSGNGVTLLDYWISDYDWKRKATVFVKIADDLANEQTIYTYYGNSEASDLSDAEATVTYYDDGTSGNWNTTVSGSATLTHSGGKLVAFEDSVDDAFAVGIIDSNWNMSYEILMDEQENELSTTHQNYFGYFDEDNIDELCGSSGTVAAKRRVNIIRYHQNDQNYPNQILVFYTDTSNDVWYWNDITGWSASAVFYEANGTLLMKMWSDGTTIYSDVIRAGTTLFTGVQGPPSIAISSVKGYFETPCLAWTQIFTDIHYFEASVPYFLGRNITIPEPVHGEWWAEEETEEETEPAWQVVNAITLYFAVPFDYWALNMILIFGGLIIMLVSVCLMAKKVRDRTITRDAGILLLFLFFVGWGLFIGGAVIG